MDPSVQQQIISLIERSQRILLCTHRKPDGDAVGSLMALWNTLNLLGKEVTAACADILPDTFHFLPSLDQVRQNIPGGRDFVVTLDCDKTEVDRLKYHLEDNKIHIVITPKKGHFIADNVSCRERSGAFDLIITADVADIPQLGALYQENTELFTSLPLINIDHHASNTNFGKLNYINVQASSTAEILFGLIRDMEKHFDKSLMNPELATFLLSGITTDTGSFQNANTTPRSMEVAADLIEAGANQHDVIKYLFRTKKLSTLKLWGKILTKIEVDEKHRLVWSSLSQQDLLQSGAEMDEVGEIIDELLVHAPEAEIVALFKEDKDQISVSFRSMSSQASVMDIAKRFGGGGHVQAAGVKFPGKKLSEVMNQVISALQSAQQKRLGLDGILDDSSESPVEGTPQVLDGYTPPSLPVRPTLEEKSRDQRMSPSPAPQAPPPSPLEDQTPPQEAPSSTPPTAAPAAEGSSTRPAEALGKVIEGKGMDIPPGAPKPAASVSPPDLHEQARAAITAEQSQPSNGSHTPSRQIEQKRPEKPQVAPRFQEETPESFKKSSSQASNPVPPDPPLLPSEDFEEDEEGLSVSYGNAVTPAPEIPQDSSEPVITSPSHPSAQNSSSASPDARVSARGEESSAAQNRDDEEDPEIPSGPTKDPFTPGDDGLTDIERALGGL